MSLQNRAVEKLHREVSPDLDEVLSWSACDIHELMGRAAELRDQGHGRIISYSPKVFIPLTNCAVTSATIAPLPNRHGKGNGPI